MSSLPFANRFSYPALLGVIIVNNFRYSFVVMIEISKVLYGLHRLAFQLTKSLFNAWPLVETYFPALPGLFFYTTRSRPSLRVNNFGVKYIDKADIHLRNMLNKMVCELTIFGISLNSYLVKILRVMKRDQVMVAGK